MKKAWTTPKVGKGMAPCHEKAQAAAKKIQARKEAEAAKKARDKKNKKPK